MDEAARQIALSELHARPAPQAGVSGHVTRLVFLFGDGGAPAAAAAMQRICELSARPPAPAGARYHVVTFDDRELRWELHTEFVSYTFVSPGDGRSEGIWTVFSADPLVAGGHGQLAAKMAIAITREETDHCDWLPAASGDACLSQVASDRAQLTTDFRPDGQGFVHFRLCHRDLTGEEVGALTQAVLEIETYRMLALMALPLARRTGAQVQVFDAELGEITRGIEDGRDSAQAFASLSKLSAKVESELAAATFRFSAALAYGAIVEDRIRALNEKGVPDRSPVGAFLLTRLNPALRTCSSMRQALSDLALRCARATDMIRTRIDIQLAQQNNTLLNALNDRTRLQTRLQQTVEGLSIAAISYYVVGLTGYAAKGAKDAGWSPLDPSLVMAAAVPVAMIAIGYLVYRVRRAHSAGE
jgi:uncharacterized membrane-anchored protein